MILKKLTDDASATMVVWFPIILLFGLFLWIGMGVVYDRLSQWQYNFAIANPNLPVSADRIAFTGYATTTFQALLIFAIVGPLILYAVVVAKRRIDSQV